MSETAEKCSSEGQWEMRGPTTSFLKRSRLITTDTMPFIATTTLPHMTVVPKCLKSLQKKGVKTGVLSNKPDEFVDKMLKKAFPNHKFTQAWGQKPQYKTKPEPDALLALLNMSGVTPEECFYVGDSDVDVFTANNAGVKMAGVSWGFRGKNELMNAGAPFVADTTEELFDYICKFI